MDTQLIIAIAGCHTARPPHFRAGAATELHKLLSAPASFQSKTKAAGRALLLLGAYTELLRAVSADYLNGASEPPQMKHWSSSLMPSYVELPASSLFFKTYRHSTIRFDCHTQRFLGSLTVPFVERMVSWAPPVIGHCDEGQPAYLFENILSGFIASRVLGERLIKVRQLKQRPTPRFSLLDFLGALPHLEPLRDSFRHNIALLSDTPGLAQVLSGLRRAQVYRVRQHRSRMEGVG